jgi:5-(carboxyamino)imidazole ribonucleotide synthase
MGGGQLGRMFAHAAQAMGYKVAVLEPASDCPAGHAADHLLCASYTDAAALAELGEQCVAVTTEFENVPAQSLAALAGHSFVAPSADCVSVAQDRLAEKKFFTDCAQKSGVMPAPHHAITSLADIDGIDESLFPGILKTARLGYDGKGQVRVTSPSEAKAAFENLHGVVCVLRAVLMARRWCIRLQKTSIAMAFYSPPPCRVRMSRLIAPLAHRQRHWKSSGG